MCVFQCILTLPYVLYGFKHSFFWLVEGWLERLSATNEQLVRLLACDLQAVMNILRQVVRNSQVTVTICDGKSGVNFRWMKHIVACCANALTCHTHTHASFSTKIFRPFQCHYKRLSSIKLQFLLNCSNQTGENMDKYGDPADTQTPVQKCVDMLLDVFCFSLF